MQFWSILVLIALLCCNSSDNKQAFLNAHSANKPLIDTVALRLCERFNCPDSFQRLPSDTNSFAYYLSHLALKPAYARVHNFDGSLKTNEAAYMAVVDMSISDKDLQQCADAVMRLRAEYLYQQKQYSKIGFRFLGDGKIHRYLDYAGTDRSYKTFRKYMEHVFAFANTASLYAQLQKATYHSLQAGDVLIQKGQPYGHAVIVVDVCQNAAGEKKFLLAQSYMPAQETQILRCPGQSSCWYDHGKAPRIVTPEWTFDTTDLRRW